MVFCVVGVVQGGLFYHCGILCGRCGRGASFTTVVFCVVGVVQGASFYHCVGVASFYHCGILCGRCGTGELLLYHCGIQCDRCGWYREASFYRNGDVNAGHHLSYRQGLCKFVVV